MLIQRVKIARFAVGEGEALAFRHALGRQPRFFQPSIIEASSRAGQRFSSIFSAVEQLLQQPDLVVGVEHGERRLEIDQLGMAAQDLDADGVEGAEPRHALDHAADQLADAGLHLARRLVGEGDGEDLRGPRAPKAQNMGDAGGEHARLAGAGAGQHQQRAVKRLHRLALLGVQRLEIAAWLEAHGPHGGG